MASIASRMCGTGLGAIGSTRSYRELQKQIAFVSHGWVLIFRIEFDFYELGRNCKPALACWSLMNAEQILAGNRLFRRVAIGIVDVFDIIYGDMSVESKRDFRCA